MTRNFRAILIAGIALAVTAIPAHSQNFSAGYEFLKAVKERDGNKVESALAQPSGATLAYSDADGNTALHLVVRDRDQSWTSFLLSRGLAPNARNNEGNTPLLIASQLRWTEGVRALLARGAKVDIENDRGETPLIMAVHNRDLPTVQLLVNSGADPNHADNMAGYSALDYARRDGRSAAIIKILEAAPAPKEKVGPGY